MSFTEEQVKAEILRRLQSGEITRGQAKAAADRFKASQSAPQPAPQPSGSVDLTYQGSMEPGVTGQRQQLYPSMPSGSAMAGSPVMSPITPDERPYAEPTPTFDFFTGESRRTPLSESLPDWTEIPLQGSWFDQLKASAATMSTGPEETAQIIVANLGEGASWEPDEKGNPIITAPDGQRYAYKPGFRGSDVPRLVGTGLREYIFTVMTGGMDKWIRGSRAMGAAVGAARGLGAGAVEQGIEAAAGGEFDPADVALGAGLEGGLGAAISRRAGQAPTPARTQPQQADSTQVADAAESAPFPPTPPRVAPVQETAEEATSEVPMDRVANLVDKAKAGNKGAKNRLAALFEKNQQAVDDAVNLGMDVPADVLADAYEAKVTAAVSRKLPGSEGEIAWRNKVDELTSRGDELMTENRALYNVEGPSLQDSVAAIKRGFNEAKASYKVAADELYKKSANLIPEGQAFQLDDLGGFIQDRISVLGEKEVAPIMKRMLDRIEEGATMANIKKWKSDIREALSGKPGEWKDSLSKFELRKLKDEIDAAEMQAASDFGGPQMAKDLADANAAYAKYIEEGDKVAKAFGADELGNFGTKLNTAFNSIDQNQDFLRMMGAIPEESIEEVLMTGIAQASRSKSVSSATKGRFGFNEFNDFMTKLGRDSEKVDYFKRNLSEDTWKTLKALQNISKRMTKARALQQAGTGANLQPILEKFDAEGLLTKILESGAARGAASGLGAVGGKGGQAMTNAALGFMAGASKNTAEKGVNELHKLITSQRFQDIITKAVRRGMTQEKVAKQLARDSLFKKFMKAIGEDAKTGNLERWILQNMRAQQTLTDTQENE